MTKEERADKYAKGLCDGEDNFENSLIYTIHYDEYMEIAAEQQKIDIEKATTVLNKMLISLDFAQKCVTYDSQNDSQNDSQKRG